MNLDLKITLFFLSIILSFYIAFFNFYDVGRYCSIRKAKKVEQIKPYVTRYSNLQPFIGNTVIISFTLFNEKDIISIQPMILSLLDQTHKAQIILNIVDTNSYDIPSQYKDFLTINETTDYKKFTNLMPVMGVKIEANTKFIIINDNHKIYGKDFIQLLVKESNKQPNTLIISNSKDACTSEAYLVESDFFTRNIQMNVTKDCNWFNNSRKSDIKEFDFHYTENYPY
jgi:hypothetical protein